MLELLGLAETINIETELSPEAARDVLAYHVDPKGGRFLLIRDSLIANPIRGAEQFLYGDFQAHQFKLHHKIASRQIWPFIEGSIEPRSGLGSLVRIRLAMPMWIALLGAISLVFYAIVVFFLYRSGAFAVRSFPAMLAIAVGFTYIVNLLYYNYNLRRMKDFLISRLQGTEAAG